MGRSAALGGGRRAHSAFTAVLEQLQLRWMQLVERQSYLGYETSNV
jgi:hypothetical protein